MMDRKIRNEQLSCAEAREMDMVSYLESLGFRASTIRGNDHWYLSPLRNEKTPSFKVNRKLNRWYDHGIGKGGNLIDFALLYYGCSVSDCLRMLSGQQVSVHQPPAVVDRPASEPKIKVLSEGRLQSEDLLLYLRERRIGRALADTYCRELRYEFNDRAYHAIGFQNDAGGYELRNRYFKGSSSPKGITTLRNGADRLLVFEGFFDFLSYLELQGAQDETAADFLVLNSLAFAEKALPLMEQYASVLLLLDNDQAGQNCSRKLRSAFAHIKDGSKRFARFKDISDWLCERPFADR